MSDDLSGQDAFDRLLDAALTANFDARSAIERAQGFQSSERDMRDRLAKAVAELETLKAYDKRVRPVLEALWTTASRVMSIIKSGDSVSLKYPVSAELESALKASSEYCDGIPF